MEIICFFKSERQEHCLAEIKRSEYDNVFRFAVDGEDLVYLAEGSDAFMGVDLKDGDCFQPADR